MTITIIGLSIHVFIQRKWTSFGRIVSDTAGPDFVSR